MAKEFKTNNLRVPPQNIDSERALLGSIMLKPEAVYDIMDIVNDESFYSEKHRIIFKAMMELFGKSEPIDLLSLSSRLKETKQLDQIGGSTYLTEMVNSVPSAANIEHYGKIVRKKYILRNLIDVADHVSELGYDEGEDIETLLDSAEKKIFAVTNFGVTRKFTQLKESLAEAWERLDRLHNSKEELRGVPTGFSALDEKLSGFQKSDLIIIAARPSMGKTSLALDIARQAAVDHNIPVGIFSLEMGSQQLVDRMLSAEAQVDSWKLRTGKLSTDDEFQKIRKELFDCGWMIKKKNDDYTILIKFMNDYEAKIQINDILYKCEFSIYDYENNISINKKVLTKNPIEAYVQFHNQENVKKLKEQFNYDNFTEFNYENDFVYEKCYLLIDIPI